MRYLESVNSYKMTTVALTCLLLIIMLVQDVRATELPEIENYTGIPFHEGSAEEFVKAAVKPWILPSLIALIIAALLLTIFTIAAYITGYRPWLANAKIEWYQYAATVILFVLIIFIVKSANIIGVVMAGEMGYDVTGSESRELWKMALGRTSSEIIRMYGLLNDTLSVSHYVGYEGSKGASCNFLSVGFSLSLCSAMNSLQMATGTLGSTVYTNLLSVYSILHIIVLGGTVFMSVLMPIGLFLRCFQITRRFGGVLVVVALAFYTVYPLSVLAAYAVADNADIPNYVSLDDVVKDDSGDLIECNPLDPEQAYNVTMTFADNVMNKTDEVVEYVMFRGIITQVFALTITLAIVRWGFSAIGAVVNIFTLTRLI